MEPLTEVPFVIAGAVAVSAWTIAKEEIFRELREWCKQINQGGKLPWVICKAAYIPTCEYCCSFWVTLVAVYVLQYTVIWTEWRGSVLAQLFTWSLAVAYMAVFQYFRVEIRRDGIEADVIDQTSDPKQKHLKGQLGFSVPRRHPKKEGK